MAAGRLYCLLDPGVRSWHRRVQGAELQTGPGGSRARRQGGSDSGTDTDAEPGMGRAHGPRRCRSREALAEAAVASREQLAAARSGKGDGRDAAAGDVPPTPGLKQRVRSGALPGRCARYFLGRIWVQAARRWRPRAAARATAGTRRP